MSTITKSKTINKLLIETIDRLLIQNNKKPLSLIQRVIVICLWKNKSFSEITQIIPCKDSLIVKSEAEILFQSLELCLGEKVAIDNFKTVMMRNFPDLTP